MQELAPWVTPDIAAIVERALQREPEDRFATAQEMLSALVAAAPDGIELAESMVIAPTEEERATVAKRLSTPSVEAAASSNRRIAPVSYPEARDSSDSIVATAHAGADGFSETQLEFRAGERLARRRRSWPLISAVVAVVLALGGLTAGRLMRGPAEVADASDLAPSALATETAESSSAAPPMTAASAEPAERTAMVTIEPPDAEVKVDGVEVQVEDGRVIVRGSLGSVHAVWLQQGKSERTVEVVITEQGARPDEIALDSPKASRRTAGGRSAASKSDAPKATGASPPRRPPPKPTTGRVGAVDSFE